MALDPLYIVASDIEQYFVDKDSGLPLANGKLYFYRDIARSTPKTVYQLSGSPPNYTYTAMPNPIDLSAVGTVQNAGGDNEVIYYYPWITNPVTGELELDLYYIVCTDENDVVQFTREAWPNVTEGTTPSSSDTGFTNQIANPQFTEVFINDGQTTTYTVSGATDEEFVFAPDWTFVISGTGTVVIQRIAIMGSDNIITSPPYVLDISVSAGITSCHLRQRMNVNSGLWASTDSRDIYLAGTFIAKNQGVGTIGVQMFYEESTGGSPVTIVNATVTTEYGQHKENALIPLSTNTDSGVDGYIDIYLSFAASTQLRLTSIQVVPVGQDLTFDYDLDSSNREEALMGDYFIPALRAMPQESLLVGWDFPVNPAVPGESGNLTGVGTYIWDMTIAARGSSSTVSYARDSVTGGLQFTTAVAADAFYILQYLAGKDVKKILGSKLAVNVNAYRGSAGGAVTMRVYLYRGSSAATFPTLGTTIGTLSSSGTFTLTAANWTAIPRGGLDTATATLTTVAANGDINNDNDHGFSQWEITDATQIGDTDKFAIVVSFGFAAAGSVITVNSVGLSLGDIPARPAPQAYEDVLKECQYYYETSFAPGAVGTATIANAVYEPQNAYFNQGAANVSCFPNGFGFQYKSVKWTTPTLSIYSGSSTTAGRVTAFLNGSSGTGSAEAVLATYYTAFASAGVNGFAFRGTGLSTMVSPISSSTAATAGILYHYVADARPGII